MSPPTSRGTPLNPGTRGTTFRETMLGGVRLDGEDGVRPVRLDLCASTDRVMRPLGTTEARVTGRIRIAQLADDPYAAGEEHTVLRYDLDERDGDRLMRAVHAMGALLFAAGAEEVLTGVPTAPRARDMAELDTLLTRMSPRQLHLSAFHPTGTAAAGGDTRRAPADAVGRLRGVHGVLIADGSVLPSCPEVNPQLSIMAAALAVCEAHLESSARGH